MKVFALPYKPAQLHKGKREWYIYYFYKQTDGSWKQYKDRGGLNYKQLRMNPTVRTQLGKELLEAYNERLKSGWAPNGEQSQEAEYDNMRFKPALEILRELYKIKKSTLKRRTWQSYKYSVDALEKYLVQTNQQNIMLQFMNEKVMLGWFDSLTASGANKNRSINNHARNLGPLFNMAIKREIIAKNPLRNYQMLPEESGKNFPFSPKQKTLLKKAMAKSDPELLFFVKNIYHLFVRPLELLQVKLAHIDLRTWQIIIHSQFGKNKKQLPVVIPKSFRAEFKSKNLHKLPGEWFLFGRGLVPGAKSMSRNTVTKRHTQLLRACGITDPNYTMYGWKHTGNVDAYLSGVDVYDIMRQNRHHSIEETMNYLRSLGLTPNIGFSTKGPKF